MRSALSPSTGLIKVLLIVVLVGGMAPAFGSETSDENLVFIVAADMRSAAVDAFSDVCKAIDAAVLGDFMISPGDVDSDPPSAARDMLDEFFGAEYPWYPVIGNHELESPSSISYLRKLGMTLPRVVNRGPKGCEETTYSFDWADSHFVVLNLYYDGVRDWATEGGVAPELMAWLEADLDANTKKHTFVIGHEPLVPMPDLDNGRIRHQGDSLDEDPKNAFELHQLLLEHGVDAYIAAHTHCASYAKINGLWQLDPGHARGLEQASYGDAMYAAIQSVLDEGRKRGESESKALQRFYREDAYNVDKWFGYLELDGLPVIPATIVLLAAFMVLTIMGIGESAKVAVFIFISHIATLLLLLGVGVLFVFRGGPTTLVANLSAPMEISITQALFFGFAAAMLGI